MDVRPPGPLEVHLGDWPVELGPRKQRAVLAMLALEAGRTVSADRLTAGLWGEEPPPSAPKMVQLYVSHLRRVLDGDGASDRHARPRLRAAACRTASVDAVRFERLLEESRGRARRSRCGAATPLADVADEPFAAAEIRRLEELRLRAAELAIDADLEAGRHAEVIGELDALVAAAPAARAPARAAHARALPRGPAVGGARRLPRRRAPGWWSRSASSPAPSCSACTSRSSRTTRRSTCPWRPSRSPRRVTRPRRGGARARCWWAPPRSCSPASLAFGIIRVLEPDGLAGIDEDHVGLIDPDGGRITDQYSVGHSPGAVTAGGGSVWVANRLDGTVSRIDRDRQVVTIDVGGAPAALAFGAGSLWVADGDVARRRAGRSRLQQGAASGSRPPTRRARWRSPEGALWVVSGADGARPPRRPRPTLDRARAIPIGVKATAIAAGAGALWVASEEAGTVTRLDPRTGAIVDADPRRPRAERAGGRRRRGVGRQPRRRHAPRAWIPPQERGVGHE